MESFYVIVTIPRVLLTRRSHLLFVYIDTVFLDNVGKELFLALCLDHLLFVDLNVRLEQVSILLEFLQSLQAQVNFSSLKGERISLKQIFHFLGLSVHSFILYSVDVLVGLPDQSCELCISNLDWPIKDSFEFLLCWR